MDTRCWPDATAYQKAVDYASKRPEKERTLRVRSVNPIVGIEPDPHKED
jgi:hypothetical protein